MLQTIPSHHGVSRSFPVKAPSTSRIPVVKRERASSVSHAGEPSARRSFLSAISLAASSAFSRDFGDVSDFWIWNHHVIGSV